VVIKKSFALNRTLELALAAAEHDLNLEHRVRLQLADDSQLHLDRALAAEARAREAEKLLRDARDYLPNRDSEWAIREVTNRIDAAIARGEEGREKG